MTAVLWLQVLAVGLLCILCCLAASGRAQCARAAAVRRASLRRVRLRRDRRNNDLVVDVLDRQRRRSLAPQVRRYDGTTMARPR